MAEYPEKLARLIENFRLVPDRGDRIQLLIDIASRFRGVPARVATRPYPADHRVPGCESEAYVWAEPRPDGTLQYHFAVENPQGISAKATAVILDETLSGAPLGQIVQVSPDFVSTLFGHELSMGKSMGLMGIVSMVQNLARRRLASQSGSGPSPGPA